MKRFLVLWLFSTVAFAATNTLVTSNPPNQGVVAAKDTSAGAGDAAKVPLLNVFGLFDTSFINYGSSAGTVAQGNDSRIVNAVPNTRTVNGNALSSNINVGTATSVTCGTGLSGGVITTTGTCATNFGTTSITSTVGNDARVLAANVGTVVDHGTIGATVTLDFTAGNYHKFTQTDAVNETITFVDPATPRMVYVWIVPPAIPTVLPLITWPGAVTSTFYSTSGAGFYGTVFAFFWNGSIYSQQATITDMYATTITPSFLTSVQVATDNAGTNTAMWALDTSGTYIYDNVGKVLSFINGSGIFVGSATGGGKGLGTLNAAAGIYDNGTRIKTVLTGTTGTISGALTLSTCDSGTAAVTGATTSMSVVATPVTYPGDGVVWNGYVSAAGTVTVKECGLGIITPVATAYNVRVLQ